MRILSRYLLASYLRLFAVVLSIAVVLVIVVEMLVNFEQIVERPGGNSGVLAYLFVRVPSLYLRDMIPVASFAASFLCLGLPALRHEITAAKAGGIAPQRLAVPILCAAVVLSGLTLIINETFLLGATREFYRLENPNRASIFGGDSFWYHTGNIFYNVRDTDRGRKTLGGVQIFELERAGHLAESLKAERVDVMGNGRWLLHDALRRRFEPTDPSAGARVEHLAETEVDMGAGADVDQLDASEHTLTLRQLLDVARRRSGENRDAHRIRTLIHARLAAPVTVLVFALLAVPVALSVENARSLALPALYGIGGIAAFHAASYVGTLVANSGFSFAAASPWFVLLSFAAGSVWLIARAPR